MTFQIQFACGDKSFAVARNTDEPTPTASELSAIVEESCAALGFATAEELRGQLVTVKLVEATDAQTDH